MGVRSTGLHNNLDIRQTVSNGSLLPAGEHSNAAGAALALFCRVHEKMTKAIPAPLCALLREMDCIEPPGSTPCNASRTRRSTAGES
jgi:hypothetical protein